MANTLANLARMYTETTGTGTLTLTTAVPGFNTFADAGVASGSTITYAIYNGPHREIGQGVYTASGLTLTRGTVYSSTNGGAKISLTGRSEVFITPAAEDLASFSTDLTAHLNDTAGAHAASAISFSATGGISSTDVQAAIAELDSEKLSTSAAASTYQPLDSDLTTLAANITAFGHSLVDDANASAARTTLGLVIGTDVQAQDAELAAIAGLTSAADRLPYFTGSGTASLATFTTAGRNLVDDADASAQRTTLGLGTAATANTGTSGNNLPFLNGANTWSGVQTVTTTAATPAFEVSSSASFAIPFSVVSTNADALGGPGFQFFRNSASPAANDDIGFFNFRGNNSAAAGVNYLQLVGTIIDHTSGSEDSRLRVNVYRAGAQETAFTIKDGVFVGSPTGFAKGVGTLNAVAVYDDSVLLCAPVEFMKSGTVNTAMWDEYAIDETRPERIHEVEETVEIVLDEPVTEIRGQRDGTYKLETITKKKVPVLESKPVLDDNGQVVGEVKVPKVKRTVTPPQTIKRRNELAHEFKQMLDEGFDPRDPKKYFDKMLADEALPGLKTKANWVPNEESNAKRTNRIILALELQTAAFKTVYEQVEALKAEVASLKKAKP